MTPEEHAEWERSVTRAWPEETRSAGTDRWSAWFDTQRKKSRQQINRGFEQITDALATTYREQRRKMQAEFQALSLEVRTEVRAEFVECSKEIHAELAQLKRERANLHEERLDTEAATRQLRLVATGRS